MKKISNTFIEFNPENVVKSVKEFCLEDNTINLFAFLEQFDDHYYNDVFEVLDALVEKGYLEHELSEETSGLVRPVYKKVS